MLIFFSWFCLKLAWKTFENVGIFGNFGNLLPSPLPEMGQKPANMYMECPKYLGHMWHIGVTSAGRRMKYSSS